VQLFLYDRERVYSDERGGRAGRRSFHISCILPSEACDTSNASMLAPYPVPMVRRGSTGRGTGSRAPSNTPAENSKMPARTTVWFTFGCFGMRGAMSPGEGGSGREEASLSPGPAHTSSNLWQSSHSTHAVEREGSTSLQYTNCGILGPSGTDTAVMLVRDYCP